MFKNIFYFLLVILALTSCSDKGQAEVEGKAEEAATAIKATTTIKTAYVPKTLSSIMMLDEPTITSGSIEVSVNDIPVEVFSSDSKNYPLDLESLLLPGANQVSVKLLSDRAKYSIRLARYGVEEFVDGKGGREILVLSGEHDLEREFQVVGDHYVPEWASADMLDLKKDKISAEKFIRKVYSQLVNADADSLVKTLQPVFNDEYNLMPDVSVKIRQEEFIFDLQDYSTDKSYWVFDNLDTLKVRLELTANGKLFRVLRDDGSPFIRSSGNGEDGLYIFNQYIGKKNGNWYFFR